MTTASLGGCLCGRVRYVVDTAALETCYATAPPASTRQARR